MNVGDKVFWNTEFGKIPALVTSPPTTGKASYQQSATGSGHFLSALDGPTLIQIIIDDGPEKGKLLTVKLTELEPRPN